MEQEVISIWPRIKNPDRRLNLSYGKLVLQMYLEARGLCGICGLPVNPDDVSLDHILPISAGGPDIPENLQLAHKHCNTSKHDEIPDDLIEIQARRQEEHKAFRRLCYQNLRTIVRAKKRATKEEAEATIHMVQNMGMPHFSYEELEKMDGKSAQYLLDVWRATKTTKGNKEISQRGFTNRLVEAIAWLKEEKTQVTPEVPSEADEIVGDPIPEGEQQTTIQVISELGIENFSWDAMNLEDCERAWQLLHCLSGGATINKERFFARIAEAIDWLQTQGNS